MRTLATDLWMVVSHLTLLHTTLYQTYDTCTEF